MTSKFGISSDLNSQIFLSNSIFNDTWHKQIEYEKFANEIWIGIVLTLIIVSLVFCLCSCFLYHQFWQWKMAYRRNIEHNHEIESIKLNFDEDSVPQYALVSGLPSYETALKMLFEQQNLKTEVAIE